MTTELTRIGEKARADSQCRFNALMHHVTDRGNLHTSFRGLKRNKAVGIDGVTKEDYAQNLDNNIKGLSGQLARGSYKPQKTRRTTIPKAGSDKRRPLGIPCFEDKIVQKTVKNTLEHIYEADFLSCSYGYRPGRSQHDALDDIGRTIQQKKVSYIVEADIKGFFDSVNHEWLLRFLEHRIADKRVIKLIQRMLTAGTVMEDGLVKADTEGTPQGSILSPLLSNVYLHYVLDLWFTKAFTQQCRGEAHYFRYADDFIACFQNKQDADMFMYELRQRLEKFHLEVEETKTKSIEFGRFTQKNLDRTSKRDSKRSCKRRRKKCKAKDKSKVEAKRKSEHKRHKPATFDFLGFTHYCSVTRYGNFKVKRKTSRKKIRSKLKELNDWLKKVRSFRKKREIFRSAVSRARGHLNYYAITDNSPMCRVFLREFRRMLFKWLNRQSQRRSYNWDTFTKALEWYEWPPGRIKVKLCPFAKSSRRL